MARRDVPICIQVILVMEDVVGCNKRALNLVKLSQQMILGSWLQKEDYLLQVDHFDRSVENQIGIRWMLFRELI